MKSSSRSVISNQTDVHERLEETVLRHQQQPFLRPIADHTREAFDGVVAALATAPNAGLILDSCCGTGFSSRQLAIGHPDSWVIGLDRSAHRLNKQSNDSRHTGTGNSLNNQTSENQQSSPDNLLLVQADCMDFWRLAVENDWQLQRHYLLYPNPYPKAAQLKKRWHGHPSFNDLIKLGGLLEVRSNWEIYIREFAQALGIVGQTDVKQEAWNPTKPLTLFERKYQESGQNLYRCLCQIG